MKKYILSFVIILQIFPSFSFGNTFFKEIYSNNSINRCCIAALSHNLYVITSLKDMENSSEYGEILMLDFQGNIVNRRVFDFGNSTGLTCIKQLGESETLFISYYVEKNINGVKERKVYVEQINIDLSTVKIFEISEYCNSNAFVRDIERMDDSKIVILEDIESFGLDEGRATIRILNMETNEQSIFFSPKNIVYYPWDILMKKEKGKISLIYSGELGEDKGLSKVMDIDILLDSVRYYQLDQSLSFYSTANYCSDSTYILSGLCYAPDLPGMINSVSVYMMNINHDTLKGTYLYPQNPEDTVLYPFFRQNVSISNNKKIAIGGVYNLDKYSFLYQDTPCWVQLTLFDENFEMITQRYFGDGVKAYYGWDITSTNDGGFAICGQIFNTQGTAHKHDLFVLKVNSEGLITGNHEIESPQMTEVLIWPNPGSDVINLKSAVQLKNAVFELYNTSGNLCHTEKLSPGTTQTIYTEHLSKGIYTYRIIDGNRLVKSGKWIKE